MQPAGPEGGGRGQPARAGTDDVCVDRDVALDHRANVAPPSTVIAKRAPIRAVSSMLEA